MNEVIGICGVGSIGAQHAKAFSSLGVGVALWDPVAPTEQIAACVDSAVVVETYDELLAAATLGVVVASPDAHHAAQVQAADRAGRPVLVEKPVAPAATDVTGLMSTLRRPDAVLVGYVLHHHASMLRTRDLVAEGAIGRIVSFHASVGAHDTLRLAQYRFKEDRDDTLYVDYSHEWAYVRWLVGPMRSCIAVAGTRGNPPLIQRPNVVDVLFRSDDVSGTAHLDYVQDPGMRELTLIGDAGAVTVSVSTNTVWLRRRLQEEIVERTEPAENGLITQAHHFIDLARGVTEPAVTLVDGRAALWIAEAVRASVANGRWTAIESEERVHP